MMKELKISSQALSHILIRTVNESVELLKERNEFTVSFVKTDSCTKNHYFDSFTQGLEWN